MNLPDPAGSSPDAPGELTMRRLAQYAQPIVDRADEWVLFSEELVTELTDAPGSYAGVLRFGSPHHALGEVAYQYAAPGPANLPGTMLYRRIS